MFLGIAYDLGNLFNDIRGETIASPCAQDGPPRCSQNGQGCPSYAQLIYPMLKHRIIHVPTRYRLLVLHFQYTFVFMKENLELKSHYVLSLIRMLQGQHVLVSFQNELSNMVKKYSNYIKLLSIFKTCVPMCKRLRVDR